ncbi:unnamed protein product [Parnassius mnemosyne]|uniref:Zinc finger PHD-type domain-containing protein n=1 Tax=Parnassius mnemosyne TaxID=213953 RepID=A0AAV1LEH9_9NEOP
MKCSACGKFMAAAEGITCPKCDRKSHRACVKVPEGVQVQPTWLCPDCKIRTPRKSDQNTPVRGLNSEYIIKQGEEKPQSPVAQGFKESELALELRRFRELRETREEFRSFRQMFDLQVRIRPPLWDLSHDLFKDKDAKLQAWFGVYKALLPDFNDLSENDKKDFEKSVQQRWRTARDAYMRCKNSMKSVKSGSEGGKRTKYVFFKHLQFLDKKHVADTEDSIEENETREDTQQDSNLESPINPRSTETVSTNPETQPQCSSQVRQDSSNTTKQSSSTPNTNPSRKRKNAKTNEDSYFDKNILEFLTKNSEIIQNDDMAFFYSLLPLTRTFDNRQKVMFRTAVMNKALEICNCPSSITPLASPMYASTSRPESSTSSMNIASPESLPSGSQDIVLYSVEEPSSQNVVRTNPNIAHTSQNSVITSLSASSFNIPSPGSRDIVLYSVEEPSFQNVVTTNRNFAYTSTSQNLENPSSDLSQYINFKQ